MIARTTVTIGPADRPAAYVDRGHHDTALLVLKPSPDMTLTLHGDLHVLRQLVVDADNALTRMAENIDDHENAEAP